MCSVDCKIETTVSRLAIEKSRLNFLPCAISAPCLMAAGVMVYDESLVDAAFEKKRGLQIYTSADRDARSDTMILEPTINKAATIGCKTPQAASAIPTIL